MNIVTVMLPELILLLAACALFLLGTSSKAASRKLAPVLAIGALIVVAIYQLIRVTSVHSGEEMRDSYGAFAVGPFAAYIKLLTAAVGIVLALLLWPTNAQGTGSASMDVGAEAGEFFGLMLLSIAGVMMVAGANDLILLFLAVELASIPGYIMVSISRPLPASQEAGVKYFFLGAMSAAVMLFGFSYLYGTTGLTKLDEIAALMGKQGGHFSHWQVLAVLMLLGGFAFKIAAVPLHAYAGDVYEGAATPVTAFLAFVPKTSGFVAIIKTLAAVGGADWAVPMPVYKLLWVVAVLTMTFGNVLALVQTGARSNLKRLLAYSSVAHSGYMLVGLTALVAAAGNPEIQRQALGGVLFYLAAYGIMNSGAFGVLMLLPSRQRVYSGPRGGNDAPLTTTAETFDDLAGVGRERLGLGLAMAVCCFSLIGIPLTVGFLGKVFLIGPALRLGTSGMNWLVALTVLNAAISAAYYLRIIAVMFLPPATPTSAKSIEAPRVFARSMPVGAAVAISVVGTLLFGFAFPVTNSLTRRVENATQLHPAASLASPSVSVAAK